MMTRSLAYLGKSGIWNDALRTNVLCIHPGYHLEAIFYEWRKTIINPFLVKVVCEIS